MNRLKLLIYILPRGKGNELISLCNKKNIAFCVLAHGRGTADSDVLTLLGIGEKDKDVVFITVDEERAKEVFTGLGESMDLKRIGGGIGLSIPLSAVLGQSISYELLAGKLPEEPAKAEKKSLFRRKE